MQCSPSARLHGAASLRDHIRLTVLAGLLGRRSVCSAEIEDELPIYPAYIDVITELMAAGVVTKGSHVRKKGYRYHANLSPADLARLANEAAARVERAEGGGA